MVARSPRWRVSSDDAPGRVSARPQPAAPRPSSRRSRGPRPCPTAAGRHALGSPHAQTPPSPVHRDPLRGLPLLVHRVQEDEQRRGRVLAARLPHEPAAASAGSDDDAERHSADRGGRRRPHAPGQPAAAASAPTGVTARGDRADRGRAAIAPTSPRRPLRPRPRGHRCPRRCRPCPWLPRFLW